jgi:nitroreductase
MIFKKILPSVIWDWFRLKKKALSQEKSLTDNFNYDQSRFRSFANAFRTNFSEPQLRAYIVMLYHGIEKGLALPSPRPGFGKPKVLNLITQIDLYLENHNMNEQIQAAINALESYIHFQKNVEGLDPEVLNEFQSLKAKYDQIDCLPTGTKSISRKEVYNFNETDVISFLNNRHSIRNFSDENISIEILKKVVLLAQKYPSVCNRQSGRIYIFENDAKGKEVLACQSGNMGFGHTANKIAIITSDLSTFLSVGERNQSWIDGGLFAMYFILSLHAYGIGSCCLNWSVEKEQDQKLRQVADIKENENIIMLIAIGKIDEEIKVATSTRDNLDYIFNDRT